MGKLVIKVQVRCIVSYADRRHYCHKREGVTRQPSEVSHWTTKTIHEQWGDLILTPCASTTYPSFAEHRMHETSSSPTPQVSNRDALASRSSLLDCSTYPWGMARPWAHSFHLFNLSHFDLERDTRLGRLYHKLPRLLMAEKGPNVSLGTCNCSVKVVGVIGDSQLAEFRSNRSKKQCTHPDGIASHRWRQYSRKAVIHHKEHQLSLA